MYAPAFYKNNIVLKTLQIKMFMLPSAEMVVILIITRETLMSRALLNNLIVLNLYLYFIEKKPLLP